MNRLELQRLLEPLARRKCPSDDPHFDLCDYAAGNIDDAYEAGVYDGEALLARQVLKEYLGMTVSPPQPPAGG